MQCSQASDCYTNAANAACSANTCGCAAGYVVKTGTSGAATLCVQCNSAAECSGATPICSSNVCVVATPYAYIGATAATGALGIYSQSITNGLIDQAGGLRNRRMR